MCNFKTIKDAADVAIATMFSGIQVRVFPAIATMTMMLRCGTFDLLCFIDMNVQALASVFLQYANIYVPIYISIL